MTQVLSKSQVSFFHDNGYLVVDNLIDRDVLARLNAQLAKWVKESCLQTTAYGEQLDGRPRFSVETGHGKATPLLRRVASPTELSADYLDFMRDNWGLDALTQLLGPNIKFNNGKINLKHPGSKTAVKYHQDFLFEPHTNDSLIAILFFMNEVTLENGPLQVVAGSHKDKLHDLWHDGVFTGAIEPALEDSLTAGAIPCVGSAGSACFMHTRLLHGSAPNLSSSPRNLCILTYTAEDAYPLQPNHIPSMHDGDLVRGQRTNRIRCVDYQMKLPEAPGGASFFEQQAAG